MSCHSQIHVGDIGSVINIGIRDQDSAIVDISEMISASFVFQKPDGTTITRIPVFVTDGTDGLLTYTTVYGDITSEGIWRVQSVIVLAAGTFHSSITNFTVSGNI